jgi:hypothetical protein
MPAMGVEEDTIEHDALMNVSTCTLPISYSTHYHMTLQFIISHSSSLTTSLLWRPGLYMPPSSMPRTRSTTSTPSAKHITTH